jgi:predicted RNA-binding Zn-ribbon protein involved in translation (DUF1610 family)
MCSTDLGECRLQTVRVFTIDLAKIKGRGEFGCPKCGARISPDDKTERTYTILDTLMRDDQLDSVMLQCNKCESHIHLVGFRVLSVTK